MKLNCKKCTEISICQYQEHFNQLIREGNTCFILKNVELGKNTATVCCHLAWISTAISLFIVTIQRVQQKELFYN